jgi:hypothetical protein
MGRKALLQPDARGVFSRQLGRRSQGTQPKFYLGRDAAEAQLRNARLEKLWALIVERARVEERGQPPVWTDNTLKVARWLAEGRCVRVGRVPLIEVSSLFVLEQVDGGSVEGIDRQTLEAEVTRQIVGRQEQAREIREEAEARVRAHYEAAREAERVLGLPDTVKTCLAPGGGVRPVLPVGQSTHEAVEKYRAHVRREKTEFGCLSDWGATKLRYLDFLLRVLPDVDLSEFDLTRINGVVSALRLRPPAETRAARKKPRPVSRKWAANVIKEFRAFLRWAHRNPEVPWRRPDDYEVEAVRIPETADEKARRGNPFNVDTFTLEDLGLLWRYATPTVRLWVVLAMNCGFARMELVTLRTDEVHLRQKHPEPEKIGLRSDETDSWIMRARHKTGVHGQWQLWPITVRAIDWWERFRPRADRPELLVTKEGRALTPQRISNDWEDLRRRIRADSPAWRGLPFKHIRKTGYDWIRRVHGVELARMWGAQGELDGGDRIAGYYSNKPWGRLHPVIRELGEWFRPVFEGVPDPFPETGPARGGPNISRALIEQIGALADGGLPPGKIAARLEISRETVRRWLQRRRG